MQKEVSLFIILQIFFHPRPLLTGDLGKKGVDDQSKFVVVQKCSKYRKSENDKLLKILM